MNRPDIYVYCVPLPAECREAVTTDTEDDGYTIYLNEKLSMDQRRRSYQHALRHIAQDDFALDDVQEIECRTHGRE